MKRKIFFVLKLVLMIPIVIVAILWLLSAYQGFVGVDGILHPVRNVFCCSTPGDVGYEFEEVNITTSDGVSIAGWYLPAQGDEAIIVAHGAGGNRASLWELGRTLNDEGYGVVLFDARAHGASGGDIMTQGWLDFQAIIEFLQAKKIAHIGAYGFSLGANIALQAASKYDAIEAVVADGASPVVLADYPLPQTLGGFLYLPYDVIYWSRLESVSASDGGFAAVSNREAVRMITPRPMLFIAAGAEPSGFEPLVVGALYDEALGLSEFVDYWLIEDVFHGGGFKAHEEAYVERLLNFFSTAW